MRTKVISRRDLFPKRCVYVLVLTLLLAGFSAYSKANVAMPQQIAVTGVVTDDTGETLPGANVFIRGTTTATVTNIDGRYSISVPNEEAVLIFSFVGYQTQEIEVGNRRTIDVTMTTDASQIDELVVVGYGTQVRATITGSIATIGSQELSVTKNTNVQNMLTGKLPGVRNIQTTSEPGVFNNQFDIRGMGSPLIVVDGVPRGDLPRMDPNDIESISVLKDASAAVYGLRAANGVILITTKSGERGKAKIEYSGYYGLQTIADRMYPIDAYNRAMLVNEISMRSNTNPTLRITDADLDDIKNGRVRNTNWYDTLLRKTAPQQQHNVSVSGGADKIDYFINLGYSDQSSFWVTNASNYKRYNLRTNVNAQITPRLKAGIRLHAMTDETNRQRQSTWEIFKMVWRARPTEPIYANDTEPYFYHAEMDFNPMATIMPEVSGFVTDKRTMFQSNLQLDYEVPYISGLTATFLFSYDRAYNDNSNFGREYSEFRYNEVTQTFYRSAFRNSPSHLTRHFGNSYSSLWNARLSYSATFAALHNVSALALYEERYSQSYNFQAERYFDIPIPFLFAGNAENQTIGGSGITEDANRAVVGRINYDYARKYMLEFSFRFDGSSNFPQGSQWGFFPSIQLGYRISEEAFIKDNFFFVDNLKFRGTWGKMGDDRAAAFQFIEGFDYPATNHNREVMGRGYIFGNTIVNALGFRNAPNPYITWYTSVMKNVGVDADFLNGLLGFSVDLFQRDREDLLASPATVVPGTFGSGLSQVNYEADRTKGLEVELRHRNRIDQFSYNFSGFVQMTRSMWTKRVQADRNNHYDYWRNNNVNRWNDIWFGRGSDGVYQSWEEIANCMFATAETLPGDPKYLDWNGDGWIADDDNHPIATTTNPSTDVRNQRNYPLMNFGFSVGGAWKALDFNLLFQGAAMTYIAYPEQLYRPMEWDGNALDMFLDRWRPADPKIDPYDPSAEWISGFYPYGRMRAPENSEFNMQKGDYLRLKSAEIGFTVPQNSVFERLKIQRMRVYFNAYNLFTITGVKGMDPERPSELWGYVYPLNRTFNFGGSITF